MVFDSQEASREHHLSSLLTLGKREPLHERPLDIWNAIFEKAGSEEAKSFGLQGFFYSDGTGAKMPREFKILDGNSQAVKDGTFFSRIMEGRSEGNPFYVYIISHTWSDIFKKAIPPELEYVKKTFNMTKVSAIPAALRPKQVKVWREFKLTASKHLTKNDSSTNVVLESYEINRSRGPVTSEVGTSGSLQKTVWALAVKLAVEEYDIEVGRGTASAPVDALVKKDGEERAAIVHDCV